MAITHAELLTEDGKLGVAAVTDEDRRLGRTDHNRATLTLVNEYLSDMVMNVELAVVAVINGEVFSIQFAWYSEEELSLFLLEKQLTICGSLCSPVTIIPRVRFLAISCTGCGSACHISLIVDALHLALLISLHLVLSLPLAGACTFGAFTIASLLHHFYAAAHFLPSLFIFHQQL